MGMNRFVGLLLVCELSLACGSVRIDGGPLPARRRISCPDCLAIAGVQLFDGEQTVRDATVLIEGAEVREILSEDVDLEVREIIRGEGLTLLPGLIDAHVHIQATATVRSPFPEKALVEASLKAMLRAGVTTALDMKGGGRMSFEYRDRIRDGRLWGPRLLVTGPSHTRSGHAHCPRGVPPLDQCVPLSDPASARRAVRAIAPHRPDFIKIGLSPAAELDLPTLTALIDEAHGAGLRVIVHVVDSADMKLALAAGARAFAHMPSGDRLGPELIRELVRLEAVIVPTLAPARSLLELSQGTLALHQADVELDVLPATLAQLADSSVIGPFQTPQAQQRYAELLGNMLYNLRACAHAGVRIVFGTDSGFVATFFGVSVVREAMLDVSAGMSPQSVLVSATSAAADFLQRSDVGRIAPQKQADLLLIRGDPLKDIGALQNVERVFLAGQQVDRGALELPQGLSLERRPTSTQAQGAACLGPGECGLSLGCSFRSDCLSLCRQSTECTPAAACVLVAAHVRACLSSDRCDPFSQDCPNEAACTLAENGATFCQSTGTGAAGAACSRQQPCSRGAMCDFTSQICRKFCHPSATPGDCASGQRCVDLSAQVGRSIGWCAP